uniref:Putative secreted protein n=1 Tax=Amblyomma cajennense TaxID=34607 RepID=A0A023FU72_AMBCJ
MTRCAATCLFVLTCILHLMNVVTSGGSRTNTPFEERESNFPYQNVKAALSIPGKIYVMSRNYGTSTKHRCLFLQRAKSFSLTKYRVILGSTTVYSKMFLVKFSTSFEVVRTGHHKKPNAVVYKHQPGDPRKLRKLMYMDKKKTCMIFVDDRSSADERAKCNLMRPARYANEPVPEDCLRVYNKNCQGEKVKLYRRWCKLLPERWYSSYKNKRNKGASSRAE